MKYIDMVGDEDGSYDLAIKFSDMDNKKLRKLSRSTARALFRYASGGDEELHRGINGIIRKSLDSRINISFWSKGLEKDAYLINRAMRSSFKTSAPIVYKGISRTEDSDLVLNAGIGERLSFHEFISTSYLPVVAKNFAKTGVILEIIAPIGIPIPSNRDEREFLLPAQTKFKIVEKEDKMWGDNYEGYKKFTVVRVKQYLGLGAEMI